MQVYQQACDNCLLSPNAIVSPERRKEILQACKDKQTFFVCHRSSMDGGNVCCSKFFDQLGHLSQAVRIAERLGVVQFVPLPEDDHALMSHRELVAGAAR